MRTWNALLIVSLAAACSRQGPDPTEAAQESGHEQTPLVIPEAVPAEAAGVALVQFPDVLRELWDTGLLGELDEKRGDALDEELESYLENAIGLRVGDADSAFLFALAPEKGGDPAIAIGLSGVEGSLSTSEVGSHAGASLHALPDMPGVAALRESLILAGHERAVTASLDVMEGEAEGLSDDSMVGSLLAEDAGTAYFALALESSAIPAPDIQQARQQFGVEGALVAVGSRGLRASLRGDESGLEGLAGMMNTALHQGLQQLESEKERAKQSGGPAEAIATILASHHFEAATEQLDPQVEDGKLSIEVPMTLSDPQVVVSLVGVGAAVAVPAFTQYVRRAKEAEARGNLTRIAKSVRAYPHRNASEGDAEQTLPPSAPLSPPDPGACCDSCAPNPELWEHEGWQALDFSLEVPHHFSYALERTEDLFIASAVGDPGCEGELKRFAIAIEITSDGSLRSGDVRDMGPAGDLDRLRQLGKE